MPPNKLPFGGEPVIEIATKDPAVTEKDVTSPIHDLLLHLKNGRIARRTLVILTTEIAVHYRRYG